jgi:hypothetical protein
MRIQVAERELFPAAIGELAQKCTGETAQARSDF